MLLSGCSATRFLKENESFYSGAAINLNPQGEIADKKNLKKELESLDSHEPNSTILGSRPGVWFFFIAGEPTKPKGLKHFIKYKLGKEPVLLSSIDPGQTSLLMENYLDNEGYFGSLVQFEIITKKKKSKVNYSVTLQQPFSIREIKYDLFDTTKIPAREYERHPILKTGQRYSLQALQADQKKVESLAKNSGYYYFDHRYLLFEGDSTVGDRQIDLTLLFEPGTPEKALRQYTFETITVDPDYSFDKDSLTTKGDTLIVDGYRYIDNQSFRPKIITDVINLEPDSRYSRNDHLNTLSRLMSLQTFKFVNIKFREADDSTTLHAEINLTPQLKKSIRMQAQGVSKSNNFVGPGFEVTYTNRNLFQGAELFQLKLHGAYEWQISRQQAGSLNSVEVGTEASITFPRFIAPVKIKNTSLKYVPQTILKSGIDFQQRLSYYRLTSITTGVGYQWRETTSKSHELFPVDLSFVRSSRTSPEFDSLLMENPTLANSFQNQFIPGLRYTYVFNSQLRDAPENNYQPKINKSDFFFQGTIGLAGNVINGLQSAFTKSEEEPRTLFSLPYSQYARGETDFRYYLRLDKRNKIASRINIGVGYAYGNSTILPYIKQFAVGGSNSLRAFPARSVGPGTYNVRTDENFTSDTYFIDQRGDIKIDASIEYRFDIYKGLKGALFVDAGNIWLMKNDENRPGGQFEWNTFLGQLAMGTGVGIRYDFNFFVLRLDTAFPIRKPYLPADQRWVFDQVDFGSPSWRKENLVFNIAIGYPF